ncbi:endo alpha-1,4 polygalactosaminidase [Oligoflexia bacterium]|nr:endo alpha-1,4 polygalactosaminidase [Oligoflexia bacterium]
MNKHLFFLQIVSLLFCFNVYAQTGRLANVKSWAYQLQEIDLAALASSSFDLVVIDYSADGSDSSAFTAAQIQTLKDANKLVVAYFSIGEAEDYRFYWKNKWVEVSSGAACDVELTGRSPQWLDDPNENWCGNYKVKYWARAWKRILFGRKAGNKKSFLDRIIDAGFDGVYLDIIDGFEYWGNKRGKPRMKQAAKKMAALVEVLAKYAREKRGVADFVVIPQNGAAILDELSDKKKASFFAAIDGIGAEDTFYIGDDDEDNALDPQEDIIQFLGEFMDAGKAVLAVDYLTDTAKIQDFIQRACNEGYIPQVALRELDSLSTHTTETCIGDAT